MLFAILLLAADANFQALHEGVPTETLRMENVELRRDKGSLTLKNGQLSFVKAVQDRPVIAVFTGEGVFRLKPEIPIEANYLVRVSGKPEVEEAFDSAVFFFSDATYDEVKKQASAMPLDPRAAQVLKNIREKVKIEAEILAELYNPKQNQSFRAYLHGKKYNDLRFLVVPSGALHGIQAPEEVALENVDPEKGGIWYLAHLQGEVPDSAENKREVLATHYLIDTDVAKGGALSATTQIDFTAVMAGVKVMRVDLLPSLRVKRITDDKGREMTFIQGSSVHVILAAPLEAGKKYSLKFEYEGNKVIRDEGGGNFSVVARESWYPNVNTFLDHATYDLKFRIPKRFTLVAVGKLVSESKDGDTAVSEWKSDVPIAVAGFNYGEFKKKKVTDEQAKYDLEVYTTQNVPSSLAPFEHQMALTPSAMAQNALVDAQNSMRVYQQIFGEAPYGRLAVTQQPAFSFGQSWPTLVYLPVSAFLDETQRWTLMGAEAFRFSEFILEVTPHEVAHQWWGHMVGWASYHDQWLSEGFAEFSAGLFLEYTQKGPEVQKFWERLHTEITEKNNYGNSANDAGPIWLGLRLSTPKTAGAYRRMVYPKGAYILQMIRMLMRDDKTGDQDFSDMMKDYVKTHLYQNATSESFLAVVAKHMKPIMDLDGSHNMDWFKKEWIYGTDLPKYRLDYSLKPSADGKVRLTAKLTESDVSPDFVMRVPIYLDFDGRVIRMGLILMHGNMTTPEINVDLPKRPKRVLLSANHDVLAAETVVKEIP
jgi:peptidase M1-like protein